MHVLKTRLGGIKEFPDENEEVIYFNFLVLLIEESRVYKD